MYYYYYLIANYCCSSGASETRDRKRKMNLTKDVFHNGLYTATIHNNKIYVCACVCWLLSSSSCFCMAVANRFMFVSSKIYFYLRLIRRSRNEGVLHNPLTKEHYSQGIRPESYSCSQLSYVQRDVEAAMEVGVRKKKKKTRTTMIIIINMFSASELEKKSSFYGKLYRSESRKIIFQYLILLLLFFSLKWQSNDSDFHKNSST